ncbi:MAG: copper-binding protein [Acidobacteriia bacterium]|nr:copper-binding protein [Terriglobia bacterium]
MNSILKQVARRVALIASLLAGGAGLAVAHHSFAAFDITTQKDVTGTVKKFDWTNPHTWVWIDVANDHGGVDTWGFEGMSPNFLARRGWNRTTLKPGDKLTVTFRPMKNGDKGGMWVTGKRPDGEVLLMGGAITDP